MGICASTTEEDTNVLRESDDALSTASEVKVSPQKSQSKPKAAVESAEVKTLLVESVEVNTWIDPEEEAQEPPSSSVEQRLDELDKEREQIDDHLKAMLHVVAGAESTSRCPSSPSPQVPAAESSSPPATEAQVPEMFSPLTSAKSEVKAAEQYMNSIEQSPARFGYQVACSFETVAHHPDLCVSAQNPKSKEYLSELEKAQSSVLDGRQNVKSIKSERRYITAPRMPVCFVRLSLLSRKKMVKVEGMAVVGVTGDKSAGEVVRVDASLCA